LINTGAGIYVLKKSLISTPLSNVSVTAKMFNSDSLERLFSVLQLVEEQMGDARMGVKLFAVDGTYSKMILVMDWIIKHVIKLDFDSREIEFDARLMHKLWRVADVLLGDDRLVKGLTHFFEEKLGLPGHRSHDCRIVLKNGIDSFKNRPFRPVSEEEDLVLCEYLHYNLRDGKISMSSSPIASPLLFVCKKDRKLRLCVDY
jgi:hypothetical protein